MMHEWITWENVFGVIGYVVLGILALSMFIAFRKHNNDLLKHEDDKRRAYYQYVKENWMYINNEDDE